MSPNADEPNILVNLVDADHTYLKGLRGKQLTSLAQVFDYVDLTSYVRKTFDRVAQSELNRLVERTNPDWEEAREAFLHPEDKRCFSSELAKTITSFISTAELGFFKETVRETILGKYLTIPENTDEIIERVSKIPLCSNGP